MNLRDIDSQVLLENTKKLCLEERRITSDILHHLREIEFRRLHVGMGHPSLFQYAVKELGYSEDAAYRRINAMRLIKSLPEIESKIKDGSMSLTKAAKIQRFIRSNEAQHQLQSYEPRNAADVRADVAGEFGEGFAGADATAGTALRLQTKQEKLDWIETLENKSIQEIEKEFIKINPESVPREKVRQITEEKIELKLIIDEELKAQLDRLKEFLSHRNPSMTYYDLIKYLAKLGLQKFDPTNKNDLKKLNEKLSQKVSDNHQRNVSGQPRKDASNSASRYISSVVRQEVYMRDKGCCSYSDPNTKNKCESRYRLQYDHKYPFSLGGENTVENLRLLCLQHHMYVTENARMVGL